MMGEKPLEKRTEHRHVETTLQYPVSCIMRHEGREIIAEVVNYHYRGACLRLPDAVRGDHRITDGLFKLDFLLGKVRIREDMPYRVCWHDIQNSGTLGLEFLAKSQNISSRANRFIVNLAHKPRLEAKDPLDPNRVLFLNVNDISETGLLAQTSLTNKHVLPGMRLPKTKIIIPGQDTIIVDLAVENTRRGVGDDNFLLGLSVSNDRAQFKQAMRSYLSEMAPMAHSADDHLTKLADAGFLSKKLKQVVSYRTIQTSAEYEDVLKLRFAGYGKHNKIRSGTTWLQQGDGLECEGMIIGGYLAGRLVCSMEIRFGEDQLPLRSEQLNGGKPIQGVDRRRIVEVNKLVIHPKLQGSDVVLGMMQRVHAIVVTKGQFDVLLAATDQLSPLYARIGAERVGLRVPHPFLMDEYLNFMIVRREVYHDGLRFNPHAWNTIYQALHEHFSSLGLTTERKFSTLDQIKAVAARIAEPIYKQMKKKRSQKNRLNDAQSQQGLQLERTGFTDPKWTRQEILATVMHPYIVAASEMVGTQKIDSILDAIGISREYIKSPVNWLSVAFHDEFLDRFAEFGDPSVLSRNAGIRSLERDIQGVNYYFLKHFMSLHLVFQQMTRVGQKFNRTRTYELVKAKRNGVTIALGATASSLLPRRRESCLNWQASFEALIQLMTKKQGRVTKTSCVYEGHATCTYDLEWESGGLKTSLFVGAMLLAISSGAGWLTSRYSSGSLGPAMVGLSVGLITALLGVVLQLRRESSRFHSASKEFEGFQREAGEKYMELQESKKRVDEMYREARILEQTSRDIQSNKNLHDILSVTLKGVCQNFSFDRAFVMLVNENRDLLQTAAIAGVESNAEILWKFSVEVSQRRPQAVVLSSVYHSGNPIVINDIDAHLFQLNEASRDVIIKLGTQGFIIVQIPGRDGSWGVMVADQQHKKQLLGQRDIKVLERLAQQLGVALDKRADYEREERLRNYFQRYVPSTVVAESLGQGRPILGGQMRPIVAMFVDIRGFTNIAASLTPSATVNFLNRFFSVLEPTISEYGGVVDKYLGDGALVTWGALGTTKPDPSKAILAAQALLQRIELLNAAGMHSGQPRLEVGIGLHMGQAVVGNIGSENRVEFTSIGSAVNYASRLEGLCKSLACSIVASSDIGLAHCKGWEEVRSVTIRGISEPQNVWIYRLLREGRVAQDSEERSVA